MTVRRSVLWFRRDLRLNDHPALLAARENADEVVALIVIDPALEGTGRRRDRWLASVQALADSLDGALVVRRGAPADVVPAVAEEAGAAQVHISAEVTPYGRRRDRRVREALSAQGRELVATGSPYAVGPGTIVNGSGDPYAVFTPFAKAWRAHGWADPAIRPRPTWADGLRSDEMPKPQASALADTPAAGEEAARRHWRRFVDSDLPGYAGDRDRADLDTTSRMSVPLKYGEIHPRTLLSDALAADAPRKDIDKFVSEVAWREFYADVLFAEPRSAWRDLKPALSAMSYDDPADAAELIQAWREGRTGFPFVDAGMRQLLGEGWMHNRVRMVTASFLTKHLHVWWPIGARHFLAHLIDGDIASNNHGWQWVAGTGTDAAPYFRVFNPVLQGTKFDPDGAYVRRWIPELRHVQGGRVHEPWKHDDAYSEGYPRPIVDLGAERTEALDRYSSARADSGGSP